VTSRKMSDYVFIKAFLSLFITNVIKKKETHQSQCFKTEMVKKKSCKNHIRDLVD